jgi:membrane protein
MGRLKMGSEVTNDKKKKGKITDAISKWIPVLTVFIPLAVPVGNAVGNAILNFFNYYYAGKAEEFYEIPSRYFVNSIIDDKFVTFVHIVAYLMLLGSPLIIRKLFKINRFDVFTSFFCSLFITLSVSMTVMQSIIKIIGIFNLEAKDNITDTVIIAVVVLIVVIAIIIFVLYMYLFMKDFSSARKEDLEKQESIIIDEKAEEGNDKKKKEKKKKEKKKSIAKEVIESNNQEKAGDTRGENKSTEDKKKESDRIKNLLNVLFTIALIIVFEVIFIAIGILTADRIIEFPQNKTKYELVTINDGDKGNKRDMAVVSYKNGKAVLMDYTIIRQVTMNGKEIENLLLTKGKYRLIDIAGYQIEYKEFNAVKCEEEN